MGTTHRILAVAVALEGNPKNIVNVITGGRLGEASPFVQGLHDGLQKLGHTAGVSFEIDYLEDEPHQLGAKVKARLNNTKYDVIFPCGASALKAALSATKKFPIIFPNISDPMEDGAVKGCGQPGTNATGIRIMRRHTAPDCLELFRATVPTLKTVYTLHRRNYGPAVRALPRVRQAARRLKINLRPQILKVRADVAKRIKALKQVGPPGKPQVGLLLIPDDLVLNDRKHVLEAAHESRIPVFCPVVEWADVGPHSALGGYGIPRRVAGEAAAQYVHSVFKGAKPKHLPVKRLGGFQWVINETHAAAALGITIPPPVREAADRVV